MLLILVLLFGYTGKGAQRWLNLHFVRFEPSEIMKIVLPLTIGNIIEKKNGETNLGVIATAACYIILPFVLIAKQPDLGTATTILCIGVYTLLMAGISVRWIFYSVGLLILSSPLSWTLLHDYQKRRIMTLLMPQKDLAGDGYHIMQSKIAIGSGGIFGKGWLGGTQSHLQFLPEHNTDFIFALHAEEFGLVGCLILFIAFLWIVIKCMNYSAHAENQFTRLSCAGITFSFGLCSFINIAMVCGLLPVVGIPLPLLSYGGTTMLITLFGFGVVNACKSKRQFFG